MERKATIVQGDKETAASSGTTAATRGGRGGHEVWSPLVVVLDDAVPIDHNELAPLQSSSSSRRTTTGYRSVADLEFADDDKGTDLDPPSPPPEPVSVSVLSHARILLYISHLVAQFSEGAWQFCLVLFLAAASDYKSLVLVSTYGIAAYAAVCLGGARVGRAVDSAADRWRAARAFIGGQNLAVVAASLLCLALLRRRPATATRRTTTTTFGRDGGYAGGLFTDALSVALLVGIHVFGPLAQVLDRGFLVAIERDWIVVMSKQVQVPRQSQQPQSQPQRPDQASSSSPSSSSSSSSSSSKEWLSATNVTLRQIDLTCKIVAPAVAGIVVASFGNATTTPRGGDDDDDGVGSDDPRADLTGAAILVGVLNVASLVVEYVCTARIYRLIPALAVPKKAAGTDDDDDGRDLTSSSDVAAAAAAAVVGQEDDDDQQEPHQQQQQQVQEDGDDIKKERTTVKHEQLSPQSPCRPCCFPYGLSVYFQQPIAWGGLGLAMLYVNALAFGGLMTAFLVYKGMSLEAVGLWRGLSSAMGLLGTFAYHASSKRLTVVQTGQWSIMYLFACLSLCFASFFVDDFAASMSMLIAGACLSRVGLWVFDISITQLMQEFIPDGIRGVVGGTQQSLNAFFQLFSFSLGLVFPNPRNFYIFAAAGYISIGSAMILYTMGVTTKASTFRMPNER